MRKNMVARFIKEHYDYFKKVAEPEEYGMPGDYCGHITVGAICCGLTIV